MGRSVSLNGKTAARRSQELDVAYEFGDLAPWLFDEAQIVDDVDRPDVREPIGRRLDERYSEPLRSRIAAALNTWIEQGNAEGRFTFRLIPEPVYLPEKRWFTLSPHNDYLATHIRNARSAILRAIVDAADRRVLREQDCHPLLLISLTLDDGITAEESLHDLLGNAKALRIGGFPALQLDSRHTVHDECIPTGYCTARVLSACHACRERDGPEMKKPDLRALYRRARTWLARIPWRESDVAASLPLRIRDYLSALRFVGATERLPALAYERNSRRSSCGLPASAMARLVYAKPLANNGGHTHQGPCGTGTRPESSHPRPRTRVRGPGIGAIDAQVRHLLYQWRAQGTWARSTLAAKITRVIEDEPPGSIEYLLACWARDLVGGQSQQRARLAPGTVYVQYTAASGLLASSFEPIDFDIGDADAWQNFYASVERELVEAKRAHGWGYVRQFHNYLVRTHGAGQVDFAAFNLRKSRKRVDNNIITPAEYRQALALLDNGDNASRPALCSRILLILGFRLGLRFSEARQLTIGQLEDAASPWLHVYPNPWHPRLKSDSRRIPIDPLVPSPEREELLAWRQRRLCEVGGDVSAALVGEGPRRSEPVSDFRVRDILRFAISEATGDSATRFHHLRHSFATWAFFRLVRPIIDDRILQGIRALNDAELDRATGERWRSALLVQRSGQEAMWLICELVGHASIDVTRGSYLRLLESLNLAESWSGRQLDWATLGTFLGVSRSSAHEVCQRWGRSYPRRSSGDWPSATVVHFKMRPWWSVNTGPIGLAGSGACREMLCLCEAARELREATGSRADVLRSVAEQSGLSSGHVERFDNALQEVHARVRTFHGYPRFDRVVRLPRGRAERDDLDAWISTVACGLGSGAWVQYRRLHRVITLAGSGLSYGRSSVRVRSTGAARQVLHDLQQALGVPPERLVVLTPPRHSESDKSWRQRQGQLAKATGWPRRRVQRRRGAPAVMRKPGTIEISVQCPEKRNEHQSRRASQAFRALVHYGVAWLVMERDLGHLRLSDEDRRAS